MEASIAGAGLIIAIYALFVPISKRIFKENIEDLNSKITEYKKLKAKITPESDDKEAQLKLLMIEIKAKRKFPFYLGIGAIATLFLYTTSVYLDTLWLITPSPHPAGFDNLLLFFFIAGTSFFMAVGFDVVVSIYKSMKREFDEITKKQKELKIP
jgi:hypothetical protein